MNNGHVTQSTDNDTGAFFTAGVGVASPDVNIANPENNLDLDNSTWNNESPNSVNGHDPRNIGAGALVSGNVSVGRELIGDTPVQPQPYRQEIFPEPKLGQIINLEMPPMQPPAATEIAEETQQTQVKPTKEVFFTGNDDKLTPQGLGIIKEKEAEVQQTGDIADFYDDIDNIREDLYSEGEGH